MSTTFSIPRGLLCNAARWINQMPSRRSTLTTAGCYRFHGGKLDSHSPVAYASVTLGKDFGEDFIIRPSSVEPFLNGDEAQFVVFTQKDGHVEIKCSEQRLKVPTDLTGWQDCPKFDPEVALTLNGATLGQWLTWLNGFTDPDPSQEMDHWALVNEGGVIQLSASDRRTFAHVTTEIETDTLGARYLPADLLPYLKTSGELNVEFSQNHVMVSDTFRSVLTPVFHQRRYLPLLQRQAFSKETPVRVTMDREELASAISGLVSTMSWMDKGNGWMEASLVQGALIVSHKDELIDYSASVKADSYGKMAKTARVEASYLLRAVNALKGNDRIDLHLGDQSNSVRLTATESGNPEFFVAARRQ